MRVTFYGVRGSCPCSGPRYQQVGGNTSCVLVTVDGEPPLVLDLGTGLRVLGEDLMESGGSPEAPVRVHALLTHLHLDHILGLPFFAPLHTAHASLSVFGPRPEGDSLAHALRAAVRPPVFPVEVARPGGGVTVHEARARFELGGVVVRSAPVSHRGSTLGFRVEAGGRAIVYIPDHQAPRDRTAVPEAVRKLCDGADLLVHDAQYGEGEFQDKADWGHSTPEYALHVAATCSVSHLVLFHHDPSHTDADLAAHLDHARRLPQAARVQEITLASEGATIEV